MQKHKRKLAAIVAADVAGYTRLVHREEDNTVRTLRTHRTDFIEPLLGEHGGRVANTAGDSLLLEFASVVEAVRYAVAFQQGIMKRNANIPIDDRIRFRIGVHVGDVIDQDGDLLGDGVNIAARLESLSEPDGILISDDVYRQVRIRIDGSFEQDGPKELKNIAEPIVVWRWVHGGREISSPATSIDTGQPSLDMPSIAVLPFDNMSQDPEQEHLADGITEDIITGLSRFRWLRVIARNTTFAFKGKAVDMKQIAKNLGVRYLLEGSVRKAGNRIRVTGQLIDARSGNHIWAEHYDRDLVDLFAVQDAITETIVATIAPEIEQVERQRGERSVPGDVDIWLLYQKGMAAYYESSMEGLARAIEIFDEVTRRDPKFALAHAMSADARSRYCIHFVEANQHQKLAEEALVFARRATALDGRDPLTLHALSRAFAMLGRHKEAVATAQESVLLNPNYARFHHALGYILHLAGLNQDALDSLEYAQQLSPKDGFAAGFQTVLASTLLCLSRDAEALEAARRACQSANPRWWSFAITAAASHFLDLNDEAKIAMLDLHQLYPAFSLKQLELMATNWHTQSWERLIQGLRETGAS